MRLRFAGLLLVGGLILSSVALRATPGRAPGVCPQDTKLIGLVSVFGDEHEASWWSLIFEGMNNYGFTDPDDQRDYLNGVFGTGFATLAEVQAFNLQSVSATFDKNGNGFVCAYDIRGTRAHIDDPLFDYTWFGASDDKIRK